MKLAVELYGVIVGYLEGDQRSFDFVPTTAGMDHFGVNSLVLSVTIPLVPVPKKHQAKRRRNWFAELLPEGAQYDYMLAQSGIVKGDVPGFLSRYGRDIAGALQIWDVEDPTEPRTPELRSLTVAGVRQLLEDPVGFPLANQKERGKSSIGGVQPKIVLVRDDHGWSQALGGFPTTHIFKPQLDGNSASLIYDEEYGSRLARAMGLANFDTWIEDFDGLPALVVERFDRTEGARVHQEDFSQALGASGNEKYQEMGGVVSLKRAADVLERTADPEQLRILARMVVFNIGMGNLDLHTKNLGLIHSSDGEVRLAPAYDVVPQVHMNNDGKLALSVGGSYQFDQLTADDLVMEISGWGLRDAETIVRETLLELESNATAEEPLEGAHPGLQQEIIGIVRNL